MFNLSDPNISYMLISPEKGDNLPSENNINCERICSILYSKDYTIIPVTGYYEGKYERSFIAVCAGDSDSLRFDAIYLMDKFDQDSVIVKYKGENSATKVTPDGSEKPMSVAIYDSNLSNKTYLYNGVSFSFVEMKRYFFPKKKEDLKVGMIVEFFNNNKWTQKQVFNVDTEYEKMFKLLIKYEKVRVECK
jgi:hypothetical protein